MGDESNDSGGGGGFGWFILGGLIGLAAGAYIASGPGRSQVDSLRSKTIELSGSQPVQRAKDAAQRARQAVTDPDHPVGKAIRTESPRRSASAKSWNRPRCARRSRRQTARNRGRGKVGIGGEAQPG